MFSVFFRKNGYNWKNADWIYSSIWSGKRKHSGQFFEFYFAKYAFSGTYVKKQAFSENEKRIQGGVWLYNRYEYFYYHIQY